MTRAVSLCLIFAICLGVYWTRIQSAEAKAPVTSVTGKVAVCTEKNQGKAAITACDAVLAVPDLEPATRGYFMFYKALALDFVDELDAALAAYDEAEPLTRMKRRWILNNRGWIHAHAKRWDAVATEANTLLTERPDLRDSPYFRALRLLWKRADALGDHAERERLANLYVSEEPQSLYAAKFRMRHLEKFGDRYPAFGVRLARLSDLSRIIEAQPDNYGHYEKRLELFGELGLIGHLIVDGRRFLELATQEYLADPEVSDEELRGLEAIKQGVEIAARDVVQSVQAAAQRDASGASALVQRAEANFMLGDLDRALADLDLVLAENPSRTDIVELRGQWARTRDVLVRYELLKPIVATQP